MARKRTTTPSTVAPRRKIFVDTGAWYAVASEDDRYHDAAVRYYRALLAENALLLTSDYVLDETLTRLRYDFGQRVALRFYQRVKEAEAADRLRLLRVDETTWEAAITIFSGYSDQPFSFTDCTSFALAQRESIDAAFAFDYHFRLFGLDVQPAP